jgi:hypothetical protein
LLLPGTPAEKPIPRSKIQTKTVFPFFLHTQKPFSETHPAFNSFHREKKTHFYTL